MASSQWEPVEDPETLKKFNAMQQSNTEGWEPVEDPNAVAQYNKQQKLQQIKQATGIGQPGLASNLAGGMLHGIFSIPRSMNLSEITPSSYRDVTPYAPGKAPIQKFDEYKAMGTTDQPWNTVAGAEQVAGSLLPVGGEGLIKAGQLAGKGLAKAGKFLANQFPVRSALKDLSPLEQKLAEKSNIAENAQKELGQAESSAKLSEVSSNPDIAQAKYLKNQAELQDLHHSLAETPVVSPKNVEESSANIKKLEADSRKADEIADQSKKNISQHLNEGQEFDVNAANRIKDIQQTKTKEIGSGYKDLESDFEKRDVKIENPAELSDNSSEIADLLKSNPDLLARNKDLLNEVESLGKTESINAKDYLHALQSLKQHAREARTKAFKPGMNKEERNEWDQKFRDLDDKVEDMERKLESNVGEENSVKLKELNSRWREEVVPLYKNRVYQGILRNGQMSDNIIKSIRGNNKGNQILQNIIKNDPELLKNVVGQRYAVKPSAVHNPDINMQRYIEQMPEFKAMKQQHDIAQKTKEMAKNKLEQAKESHAEIEKSSGKRTEIHEQINKLQDDIAKHDSIIKDLLAKRNRKNITLKEKMDVEKELEKQKDIKSKAQRKIAWIVGTGAALGGLHSGYRVVHGLFTNNPNGE